MNAIILAAGTSQRYGLRNKLLEPYAKGHSVIGETVAELKKVEDLDIVVVLGHEASKVRQNLNQYKVRCIENPAYKSGMVSSVKTGILACSRKKPFIICLSDMPCIKADDYLSLIQSFRLEESTSIMRPVMNGKLGNPVVFSYDLEPALLSFEGKTSFRKLVIKLGEYYKPFETSAGCFFRDIDTVDDYENVIKSTA